MLFLFLFSLYLCVCVCDAKPPREIQGKKTYRKEEKKKPEIASVEEVWTEGSSACVSLYQCACVCPSHKRM